MAIPGFVAASTGSTDATGAWSHTGPAPGAIGRLLMVHMLVDGVAVGVPTVDSVTNAEDLAGTDGVLTDFNLGLGKRNVGNPIAARVCVWLGRSTSTSAMVITGSNTGGDDIYVRVYEFVGVNAGTSINDVVENSTVGNAEGSAGTSTTVADAAVVTLGADRLALNLVGIDDDATGLVAFTGETGGDWTLATAIYESSGGTDGTIAIMEADMAAAGTINGGTATITSDNWGCYGFALIPAAAAPALPPTRDPWPWLDAVNKGATR